MRSVRSPQAGFVLALTLWILAAITVVVSYFALRVHRALTLAYDSQQNVQRLVDLDDTRAEILFRLGVTPLSIYGLGPTPNQAIALDNRPYQGAGGTIVRLQDDRGLLNLNIVSDDRLNRFLGLLGIPDNARAHMIDSLRDYQSTNNLAHRLNGATRADYIARNLPPPRNEKLLTPYEPRRIIGWIHQPLLWRNQTLPRLTTVSASVAMNPNTAPWQVLATLPGITPEGARRIIRHRQLEPIVDQDQLAALLGVPAQNFIMQIISLPADAIRVTQTAPGLPWAMQYNVSLTPMDMTAPWRIDYYFKVPTGHVDKAEKLYALPARDSLSSLSRSAVPTLP